MRARRPEGPICPTQPPLRWRRRAMQQELTPAVPHRTLDRIVSIARTLDPSLNAASDCCRPPREEQKKHAKSALAGGREDCTTW